MANRVTMDTIPLDGIVQNDAHDVKKSGFYDVFTTGSSLFLHVYDKVGRCWMVGPQKMVIRLKKGDSLKPVYRPKYDCGLNKNKKIMDIFKTHICAIPHDSGKCCPHCPCKLYG